MNRVLLTGRLTRDPELRSLAAHAYWWANQTLPGPM